MGPDAVTVLVREFELPSLATHLSFVSGLVTFLSSIGLRAWIQFGDIHPKLCRALTLLTLTCVLNMVSYFHHSINRFHLGLPVRFLVLYLHHFSVVGVLSLMSVCVSLFWMCGIVQDQVAQHGTPIGMFSMQQLPQPENSEEDFKEAIRTWRAPPHQRTAPATRKDSNAKRTP